MSHRVGVARRSHGTAGHESGFVAWHRGREAAVRRPARGGAANLAPRACFGGRPAPAFAAHVAAAGEAPTRHEFSERAGRARGAAHADEVTEARPRPLPAEQGLPRRGGASGRRALSASSEDHERGARAAGPRVG